MLKKNDVKKILSRYVLLKKSGSILKKLSDEIRTKSKTAGAILRRRNDKDADILIKKSEALLYQAKKIIKVNPELAHLGFYREAVEEYVEAKIYYCYLTSKVLKFPKTVDIGIEEQIGGIADFTGELVRHAVTIANDDVYKEIDKYKKLLQDFTEIFANISFSGKLRQKHDDLERNLKRLEEILYRLRIH